MLDLRNLRHLVVLARRLSYVRAADELGITQPSLTRSIQALEQQLQVKLFDRDRGGVSLTPQGKMIAEQARFLLTDAEDLERQSKMYGQGERGRLRFGMAPMPAHVLLRRSLTEQLAQRPNVTNEVVVRDVDALWGMLVEGEIEFFVSPDRLTRDVSEARVELLGSFPLSLMVRSGHPLLRRRTAADRRFPLIRSSWTGALVPEQIQPRVLGAPNVIEDFSTLEALTTSTDVIWLVSSYAVQDKIEEGKLVEFMRADQHVEVTLYSLKRRSQSPLALSLISALRAHMRELCSAYA